MNQTDFYEPWHPEVGQRVRVRLSGECRRPLSDGTCGAMVKVYYGHADTADGMEGVVEDARWRTSQHSVNSDHGHFYHVHFSRPFHCNGHEFWGDTFAAIELEPIDE